jgi:hypothetical protein
MEVGAGRMIMPASGPAGLREPCHPTRAVYQHSRLVGGSVVIGGVLGYLDNVDQHHARARQAGANILSVPEDAP